MLLDKEGIAAGKAIRTSLTSQGVLSHHQNPPQRTMTSQRLKSLRRIGRQLGQGLLVLKASRSLTMVDISCSKASSTMKSATMIALVAQAVLPMITSPADTVTRMIPTSPTLIEIQGQRTPPAKPSIARLRGRRRRRAAAVTDHSVRRGQLFTALYGIMTVVIRMSMASLTTLMLLKQL